MPDYQVFFAQHGAGQFCVTPEPRFPVCTTRGEMGATFYRLRASASAGVTHTPTQLHLRLSYLLAGDGLLVRQQGSESGRLSEAEAGHWQDLFALRAGHERWGQALVGDVGADRTYRFPDSDGLAIRLGDPSSRAPGLFYGVTIPELSLNAVTLSQGGRTELVSVTAADLRVPSTRVALTLGPTYIREEREVAGLLRLRYLAETERKSDVFKVVKRAQLEPLVEAADEASGARLRHARARVDGRYSFVMNRATVPGPEPGSSFERSWWSHVRVEGWAEATVFNSRFFTEALDLESGQRRGAAWGFGGGGRLTTRISFFSVGFGVGVQTNSSGRRSRLRSTGRRRR